MPLSNLSPYQQVRRALCVHWEPQYLDSRGLPLSDKRLAGDLAELRNKLARNQSALSAASHHNPSTGFVVNPAEAHRLLQQMHILQDDIRELEACV